MEILYELSASVLFLVTAYLSSGVLEVCGSGWTVIDRNRVRVFLHRQGVLFCFSVPHSNTGSAYHQHIFGSELILQTRKDHTKHHALRQSEEIERISAIDPHPPPAPSSPHAVPRTGWGAAFLERASCGAAGADQPLQPRARRQIRQRAPPPHRHRTTTPTPTRAHPASPGNGWGRQLSLCVCAVCPALSSRELSLIPPYASPPALLSSLPPCPPAHHDHTSPRGPALPPKRKQAV
jgi:hypothetical protein